MDSNRPTAIAIEEYNYELPNEKIAFHPKENRVDSKLLVYQTGGISDKKFQDLPSLLSHEDYLVFNNTRVINARLWFQKTSGKIIEIFCLEPLRKEIIQALSETEKSSWKCLVGGAKRWKQNPLEKSIEIEGKSIVVKASKGEYQNGAFEITFEWDNEEVTFSEILEKLGNTPLPPYIKRENTLEDEARYQTVYSKLEGSVAAPTAGLHFSDDILKQFTSKNIGYDFLTLHVGAGTFKPVTAETIGDHDMHFEAFEVSLPFLLNLLENHSKRIISVGTTSCRTLESLYWLGCKLVSNQIGHTSPLELTQWEAYNLKSLDITAEKSLAALIEYAKNNGNKLLGKTQLMIAPGYTYQLVGGLITNFHLPQSTLLLLVSALVGENWKKIYDYALHHDFRFLSYGDSSILLPN